MSKVNEKGELSLFDIIILLLSVYVIITLIIDTFFKLSDEVSKLLLYIDNLICIIFLADFTNRLIKAPSKLQFMKWGWIDLISSIPTFQYFRYGRLIRLFRILRILRAFRSVKFIVQHVFRNRKQGTFASVAIVAFMMLIFGSISVLQVEKDPNCNIKTAEDAIWWSFVTITTVGYGDKYPITTEGRIIAAFLMVAGVGLFGTFTGFVASWFMGDKKNDD
jgi:voltage-gated potassium channel